MRLDLHGFDAIFKVMTLRNAIRRILQEATTPDATGVAPQAPDATAPVPALQARAQGAVGASSAPWETYNTQVERVAQKVAKALGMMEVHYLAKSKRNFGAVAYKAISPNYMNVIIKIAPEHELEGYRRVEDIKRDMPEHVAKHLPHIYKLTNMKKLGIEWPKASPGEQPRNLGIIVMEVLETLPGPLFDLIKNPPAADDFVLETFLTDHHLLDSFIERFLVGQQVNQTLEMFLDRSRPGYEVSVIDELKSVLKTRLLLLQNFKYPRFQPSMLHRSDLKKKSQRIDVLRPQIKRLIQQALQQFDPGIELMSDAVTSLADEFGALLEGQTRAIPTEPSMGGRFGVMSDAGTLDDFRQSVNYMMDHGVFVSDLHANNLMIRPQTGDIVIADLGHFDHEDNFQGSST